MSNGDGDGFQIIEEKAVHDIYTDSVNFLLTIYGVGLEFGLSQRGSPATPGRVPHIPKIRVYMSPQHAKVLAKLLAKNMQAYEEQIGPIAIPKPLLDDLGIDDKW